MMTEQFYRDAEGKLIFNAIPSIGDNTIDVSHLYRYHECSWPKEQPKEIQTFTMTFDNLIDTNTERPIEIEVRTDQVESLLSAKEAGQQAAQYLRDMWLNVERT